MDSSHAQNDSTEAGGSDGAQPDVAVVASDSSGSDIDLVGPHVASVLLAAKEAAARMMEEAAVESGRVLEQARQDAAATVDAVRREAASIISEREQRQKALERSIAEGEERSHQLSSQLHDLAVQIDSLAHPEGEPEAGSVSAEEAEPNEEAKSPLDQAIRLSGLT